MGKFSFGQAGVSYECDKVDLKVHEGAPRCPRCDQRVYFNEEKKALGKSWHTRCFTCCKCKKALSSTNYNELEGDIVCTTCHRRHSTTAVTSQRLSHTATDSTGPTNTSPAAATADDAASQSLSHTQGTESVRASSLPLRRQLVSQQDADCCPQCGQTVYFAEEIKALKRKWHRLCFKCVSCKRTLEPGKCTEHDGQLFCHQCHHKQFGPHVLRTVPAAAAASDAGRLGNGSLAYTDTFEMGDDADEDDDDGDVRMKPFQPIRGAQEWTESFVYDQTTSVDYQKYRLQ